MNNKTTAVATPPKKRRVIKERNPLILKFFCQISGNNVIQAHQFFSLNVLKEILDVTFPGALNISKCESGYRLEYNPQVLLNRRASLWARIKFMFFPNKNPFTK